MKCFKQFLVGFLLISMFFIGLGSFADCGDAAPNEMDKQCAGVCSGTDDDPKGCYHPPDSSTSLTDAMCSDKTSGKYTKAKDTICCCE